MQIGFCHWEGMPSDCIDLRIPKGCSNLLGVWGCCKCNKGWRADKTPAAFCRCEIAAESCYDPSRDVFKDYLYSERWTRTSCVKICWATNLAKTWADTAEVKHVDKCRFLKLHDTTPPSTLYNMLCICMCIWYTHTYRQHINVNGGVYTTFHTHSMFDLYPFRLVAHQT